MSFLVLFIGCYIFLTLTVIGMAVMSDIDILYTISEILWFGFPIILLIALLVFAFQLL